MTKPSMFVLYVTAVVGGCLWPISVMEIKNRVLNFDSIVLDRTLQIMVHSKLMDKLSGGWFTGVLLG